MTDGDAFTNSIDISLLYIDSKVDNVMVIKNNGTSFNTIVKNIYHNISKN